MTESRTLAVRSRTLLLYVVCETPWSSTLVQFEMPSFDRWPDRVKVPLHLGEK